MDSSESFVTSSIQIETENEPVARPKMRLFPVKFTPEIVEEWHSTMLPRLERLIERALKDSEETVSIDLVAAAHAGFHVQYPWMSRSPSPRIRPEIDRFTPFCGMSFDITVYQ